MILVRTVSTDNPTTEIGCFNDVAAPVLEVLEAPAAPAVPVPEPPDAPVPVALASLFFHGDAVTVYVTLDCDHENTDPLGGAVSAVAAPVLYSVWVPLAGKLLGL